MELSELKDGQHVMFARADGRWDLKRYHATPPELFEDICVVDGEADADQAIKNLARAAIVL